MDRLLPALSRRGGPFKRALALLLALTLAVQPLGQRLAYLSALTALTGVWRAYAETFENAAVSGQAAGEQLLREFGLTGDAGELRFRQSDGALGTVPMTELFQTGGAGDDRANVDAAYGDDAATEALSSSVVTRLGSEDSAQGEAYRTVRGSALGRAHPDLGQDPVWGRSRGILDGNDPIYGTFFEDCTATSVPAAGGPSAHVPDYQTCERILRPASGACSIEHQVNVSSRLHRVFTGAYGVSENTFEFDLKTGAWASVEPSDGSAFDGNAPVADQAEICDGSHRYEYLGAFDWPEAQVPGEFDSSVCYEVLQHPTCENDLIGRVRLLDNCSGGQGWYKYGAEFHFRYSKLVADSWTPYGCIDTAQGIADGICQGSYACTTGPDASGCVTLGGVQVCEGDPLAALLSPAPVPGIDALCARVSVDADCAFNAGPMDCWTDPAGVLHCPTNTGEIADTCGLLEANPSCAFVRSECIEGLQGPSGECYAYTEVWDCGYDVGLPGGGETVTYACDGAIRCMGEECVSHTREANPDFGRAASLLQATQFMVMDTDCGPPAAAGGSADAIEPACRIFKGEARTCKKALGGVIDCCEKPTGASMADYLKLAYAGWEVSQRAGLVEALAQAGMDIPGAWSAMTEPVSATWSAATEPFTSAWGSLTGSGTGAAAADVSSLSVSAVKQTITDGIAEFVGSAFGPEVQGLIFTPAEGGGWALSGTIGTALSTVMYAYLAYQVIVILIQIIWECEQSEFELGVKRQLHACHYNGSYCADDTLFGCIEKRESYCCYSSPLARIVQEQGRPQLGLDFGTAKNPICEGLTVDQVAGLDWEAIDLGEWVALLAEGGLLPSSSEAADIQYALPNATTNPWADGFTPPDAPERVRERIDAADTQGTYDKIEGDLWSLPLE